MGFCKARARKCGVEIVVGALAFFLTAASAAEGVMVTLPSNAVINAVGQTTVVNVMIGNVTGLEALGISITYNEAVCDVLTVGAVQRGPLTMDCDSPIVNITSPGRLTITLACPSTPISGSGTLFAVTFTGTGNGSTPLTFSTFSVDGMVRIPNGCLLNEGDPTCEPVNGQLTVGSVVATATATATRTGTSASTSTATRTATSSRTATRTSTPTNTIAGVATSTATNTVRTATATNTPISSVTATNTVPATSTASRTVTATITRTPTIGPSPTASNTGTPANTATITVTPTLTPEPSVTLTASSTATVAPSGTATETFTPAPATATRTITNTPESTRTRPGIPVIPSPASPGGLMLIGALAIALIWSLHRLQRQ